jgi:hypothetical protein
MQCTLIHHNCFNMAHFCSSHAGGCRGISSSPMDAGKLRSSACDFPSCSMRHMKLNNTSSDCVIASSCESHTGLTGRRSCPITLDAQVLPFCHRPHSLMTNCGQIRTCNFNSCSHLISVTSCLKRETISQKANSYLHHQDLNVLKHAPLLTRRSPSNYVLLRQRRTLTGELLTRIRSRRPETDTEAVIGTVKEGGNPLWGFFENARYLSPLYKNVFRVLGVMNRMHIQLEAFAMVLMKNSGEPINPKP